MEIAALLAPVQETTQHSAKMLVMMKANSKHLHLQI
jgi:hypothetical protein